MACNPCYEGSPSSPRGAIVGTTRFANDRAQQTAASRRPRAPACGWRHRRACAGGGRSAISYRPQSGATRGGGLAGRAGSGAGRRRHRQDPRADHAHRPHPEPGPGAAARNPVGDLHQQGGARDEAPPRPHARPGRGRHAVARHLPLDRRPDPAYPRRTGATQIQFHRARRRRSGPAAETVAASRKHRRQALAGADAGRIDRRLEEPRTDAGAGSGRRSRRVRQRQGRQALRQLPGTAENPQRRRLRRSAAGEYPPVPRASRRAPAIPEPLQVHSGRRIPGHQRRAISLAAAAVAGAVAAGHAVVGDYSGGYWHRRDSGRYPCRCHAGAHRRCEPRCAIAHRRI
jgi:hypothetical protein